MYLASEQIVDIEPELFVLLTGDMVVLCRSNQIHQYGINLLGDPRPTPEGKPIKNPILPLNKGHKMYTGDHIGPDLQHRLRPFHQYPSEARRTKPLLPVYDLLLDLHVGLDGAAEDDFHVLLEGWELFDGALQQVVQVAVEEVDVVEGRIAADFGWEAG
jgi:hypothetical protein